MKKIADVLLNIFAVGILICLFAGGLSFIGYIIAMFLGTDIAQNFCKFIFKGYLPWVIRCTSIFAGIGLLGMYFNKKKALSFDNESIVDEEVK